MCKHTIPILLIIALIGCSAPIQAETSQQVQTRLHLAINQQTALQQQIADEDEWIVGQIMSNGGRITRQIKDRQAKLERLRATLVGMGHQIDILTVKLAKIRADERDGNTPTDATGPESDLQPISDEIDRLHRQRDQLDELRAEIADTEARIYEMQSNEALAFVRTIDPAPITYTVPAGLPRSAAAAIQANVAQLNQHLRKLPAVIDTGRGNHAWSWLADARAYWDIYEQVRGPKPIPAILFRKGRDL